MRAFAFAAVLMVGGLAALPARERAPRTKPSPPIDLVARIENGTLVVCVAPRIDASVEVSAGRFSWRGDLARGECRECRFDLDDAAAELRVSATAAGVTRCLTLNPRPAPSLGRDSRNSRGESIVEFSPR